MLDSTTLLYYQQFLLCLFRENDEDFTDIMQEWAKKVPTGPPPSLHSLRARSGRSTKHHNTTMQSSTLTSKVTKSVQFTHPIVSELIGSKQPSDIMEDDAFEKPSREYIEIDDSVGDDDDELESNVPVLAFEETSNSPLNKDCECAIWVTGQEPTRKCAGLVSQVVFVHIANFTNVVLQNLIAVKAKTQDKLTPAHTVPSTIKPSSHKQGTAHLKDFGNKGLPDGCNLIWCAHYVPTIFSVIGHMLDPWRLDNKHLLKLMQIAWASIFPNIPHEIKLNDAVWTVVCYNFFVTSRTY